MNRTDLSAVLSKKTGFTKEQCKKCIDAFEESVVEALKSEEGKLSLLGFMSLESYTRKESEGRNPRTGEKMVIPKKVMVRFKTGKTLSEKLNEV